MLSDESLSVIWESSQIATLHDAILDFHSINVYRVLLRTQCERCSLELWKVEILENIVSDRVMNI